MVFIVLYMGTIVPNKEKTDAFNVKDNTFV